MSDQFDGEQASGVVETVVSVPGVGEQLRVAREARGIKAHEVAAALKLGVRQVQALEAGDWQSLPGHTFIRGFVRNYARLVQIDASPLMTQLDGVLEKPVSRLGEDDPAAAALPQSGGAISRRDRAVVLTGAGVVLLAGIVYFLLPSDLSAVRENLQGVLDSLSRKEPVAQVAAPAEQAAEPVFPPGATPQQVMNPQLQTQPGERQEGAAGVAPAPAEQAPAAPVPAEKPAIEKPAAEKPVVEKSGASEPIRLVFEKESWVEVRDRDNKVVFSQRGAPGLDQPVGGKGPFSLVLGYAPGVKLFWRGQSVDLAPHTRGDVARLVLE